MNIRDIICGDRVLIQSNADTKEVATVKGISREKGHVIVRLSNGDITDIHPSFVIKSFGQL